MGNTDIGSNSTIKINEIFYSLQGEGSRAGEPSIFIRLTGCSAKNACYKSGIVCDTEFESGNNMSLKEILNYITKFKCKWIVWSGGEPTDQLTHEIVDYFKRQGFKQAIECSGINEPPDNLDWVVLSPKIAEHAILKRWKNIQPDELRWVRKEGQAIPETKIKALKYYISPHFDGEEINDNNLNYCIQLCLDNPKWNISVQQHKLWKVR